MLLFFSPEKNIQFFSPEKNIQFFPKLIIPLETNFSLKSFVEHVLIYWGETANKLFFTICSCNKYE